MITAKQAEISSPGKSSDRSPSEARELKPSSSPSLVSNSLTPTPPSPVVTGPAPFLLSNNRAYFASLKGSLLSTRRQLTFLSAISFSFELNSCFPTPLASVEFPTSSSVTSSTFAGTKSSTSSSSEPFSTRLLLSTMLNCLTLAFLPPVGHHSLCGTTDAPPLPLLGSANRARTVSVSGWKVQTTTNLRVLCVRMPRFSCTVIEVSTVRSDGLTRLPHFSWSMRMM
uniref:(northern house mosquito) hypothetical protein n=1 Tax=Culex pipiens TaxID=7175 RepID=A0A8D8KZA7_CULPI